MKEINLKAATEIFGEVARLRMMVEDANRLKPGLDIRYLMQPSVGQDEDGKTRVFDQMQAAVLFDLPEEELQDLATKAIIGALEAKIEHWRRELKKLGVRLDDDVQPAKKGKVLRLTGPKTKDSAA